MRRPFQLLRSPNTSAELAEGPLPPGMTLKNAWTSLGEPSVRTRPTLVLGVRWPTNPPHRTANLCAWCEHSGVC